MTYILTINAGSSTLKYGLYKSDQSRLSFVYKNTIKNSGASSESLLQGLCVDLDSHIDRKLIKAIGYRIVQGGPGLSNPTKVTPELLSTLDSLVPLDPLHLPHEISLIRMIPKFLPEVLQVACFDTAFHHDIPKVAQLFPIPAQFQTPEFRRYGFHGHSYTYLSRELSRIDGNEAASKKIIFAHLGSGSSMAAVDGGKCLDTTMGLTPLGGMMMGTRPGDLDPGVIIQMMRKENLSYDSLEQLLYKESGLLGVSRKSSDMEELFTQADSGDQFAKDAIALFAYQAQKSIGALASVLGGLDTLVFSGGIGENCSHMRELICNNLTYLDLQLDNEANAAHAPVISKTGRVMVRVIKTDEEIVIAEAANNILAQELL